MMSLGVSKGNSFPVSSCWESVLCCINNTLLIISYQRSMKNTHRSCFNWGTCQATEICSRCWDLLCDWQVVTGLLDISREDDTSKSTDNLKQYRRVEGPCLFPRYRGFWNFSTKKSSPSFSRYSAWRVLLLVPTLSGYGSVCLCLCSC